MNNNVQLKRVVKEAKLNWDSKESIKVNIKRFLIEHTELSITDETPDSSTYSIIYNEREVGELGISNDAELDMTIELAFIKLKDDHQYKAMEIISEVITAMWETFTDTQRIILTPMPNSRTFWHKMGANRLNNDYLMILRGH